MVNVHARIYQFIHTMNCVSLCSCSYVGCVFVNCFLALLLFWFFVCATRCIKTTNHRIFYGCRTKVSRNEPRSSCTLYARRQWICCVQWWVSSCANQSQPSRMMYRLCEFIVRCIITIWNFNFRTRLLCTIEKKQNIKCVVCVFDANAATTTDDDCTVHTGKVTA